MKRTLNVIKWFAVLLVAQLVCPALWAAAETARESLSLDGTWQILFDSANEGRKSNWHLQEIFNGKSGNEPIAVPSSWEEIRQDYEGVAFYGRRFSIPDHWKGKSVQLRFDAVNYIAEVWLNDRVLGRHEGGYSPFEFEVDDVLRFGEENFLSLRVVGPIITQDLDIDGLRRNDMPHWRGAITGGIWQSVSLVATGRARVKDLFIEPRVGEKSAVVHVEFQNSDLIGKQVQVEVTIRPADSAGDVTASHRTDLELVPGLTSQDWTLQLADPVYWSPENPHLYQAEIRVSDKTGIQDIKRDRFGFRELTIKDKSFYLNGKPIFIKAAFFEGLYPNRLAYPDSEEMVRREIQLAKDAGFNMIRPWRKPPAPIFLDLADEMGMMVVGGMPIECMRHWPSITPFLKDRIENDVRSAVLRDRNRACVVQWEIFNEILRPELERLKHPTSMMVRRLDPTRLVLDESGGFAGGANIYLPYRFEPEVFNDVHTYPGAPLNDYFYDAYLALAKSEDDLKALGLEARKFSSSKTEPNRMTFISEIGYGSLPDLVDNNQRFQAGGNPLVPPYRYHRDLAVSLEKVLEESGLDAIYPDLKQFCLDQQAIHAEGNRRMVEAARSNPDVDGYAVHALTDGDWVLGAGLLDLFRNPKKAYWAMKEVNQERYLAVRVLPRNIYAAKGAVLRVTGINELEDAAGRLTVEIRSKSGTVVSRQEAQRVLERGVSLLLESELKTEGLSGGYTVHVKQVLADGRVAAENSCEIDVFDEKQLEIPAAEVTVLDPSGELRTFLDASGVAYKIFDRGTDLSVPVFITRFDQKRPAQENQFQAVAEFVRAGGTAVYLQPIVRQGGNPLWGTWSPAPGLVPFKVSLVQGKGLWVGVSHVVTDHPVFAGLPAKRMMGQVYENIWAPQSFAGLPSQGLIVGAVSHNWFQGEKDKQNYLGPEDAWWGAELIDLPVGKGRVILSALRLVENLGKDPVADKILRNLIAFAVVAE